MALRGGSQLTQVIDLAQVRAEVPADVERERNDVLGQGAAELALEAPVDLGGCFDRPRKIARHVQLDEARREVTYLLGAARARADEDASTLVEEARAEAIQGFSEWADDIWKECNGRYAMIALRDRETL